MMPHHENLWLTDLQQALHHQRHYIIKISKNDQIDLNTYFLPTGADAVFMLVLLKAANRSSAGAYRYMYGPRSNIGTF
jgi:N-dimethylarginine dimethylaminohydrolase